MSSLFSELRRRNVFRVAIAYVVVAWLLIQVTDIILPTFGAPDWVQKVLILVIGLGLPISMLFAWAYEMTSAGVMKTADVDRSESITSSTGQKLNYIVIGVLVIAVGFFLWERQHLAENRDAESQSDRQSDIDTLVEDSREPRSIAVLPFVNMSSDEDQDWFADGLTEELLNSLARTPDLLVAARTSSFKYKGSKEDVPTIAAALGVAHVLEGSIRRSGDRLRVTAQLIRAADGFHLWSQNYDRKSEDIISVQEDLAIAIANALETAMDPDALARMVSVGTASVPAFEAYLEGLSLEAAFSRIGNEDLVLQIRAAYQRARELDPGFSAAHSKIAEWYETQLQITSLGSSVTEDSTEELKQKFVAAMNLAIATTTDDIQQSSYQSRIAFHNLKFIRALSRLNAVIQSRPNDRDALASKSLVLVNIGRREESVAVQVELLSMTGDDPDELAARIVGMFFAGVPEQAVPAIEKMISLYPDDVGVMYQAHRTLLWAGHYDDARPLLTTIRGSEMAGDNYALAALRQSCADSDFESAKKYYAEVLALGTVTTSWIAHYTVGNITAANDSLMQYHDADELNSLAAHLTYPYFDATVYPKLQAILDEQDIVRGPPIAIPFACPPFASEVIN